MLTLVPNITFKQFLFLFSRKPTTQTILDPWCSAGDSAGMLSRSMWSLYLIALWRQKLSQGKQLHIGVPNYFCSTTLDPLRRIGATFTFYEVDSAEGGNLKNLQSQFGTVPDVLIFANYFGNSAEATTDLRMFANNTGCWLVEDCAHVLKPVASIGSIGDFVLYSPHKLLATPSGAFLVIKQNGPNQMSLNQELFDSPETWVEQVLAAANKDGVPLSNPIMDEMTWLLKRIVQSLGLFRKPRNVMNFFEDPISPKVFTHPEPAAFAKKSLRYLCGNSTEVSLADRVLSLPGTKDRLKREQQSRQINSTVWAQMIEDMSGGKLKSISTTDPRHTPYLAGFEGSHKDIYQVFNLLQQNGFPVTTWPDLPKDSSENAKKLRETRLFLPVHQSIKAKQILRKSKKITGRIRKSQVSFKEIKNLSSWNDLLNNVQFSNLMNAWEYAEAKSQAEGWHVRRYVACENDREIALLQILHQQKFGFVRIYRVARGPLFFDHISSTDQRNVYLSLSKIFRRFSIISISPNAEIGATNWIPWKVMYKAGDTSWTSSRVDISFPESDLLSNLNGKWRNQLKAAQKSNIEVKIDQDRGGQRFTERYRLFQSTKGFEGLDLDFLGKLNELFLQSGKILILEAHKESDFYGAIVVVVHGKTATYLAGVSEEDGRRSNVTNLLLWSAIQELKKRDVQFLDLGGLDFDSTLSIANFKMGLSGHVYQLLGEFLVIRI